MPISHSSAHRCCFIAMAFLLSGPLAANAAPSCSVSATTVAFGTVAFSTVNSTGTVKITCSGSAATFTVALSNGAAGSYTPRQMSSGSNKLKYNLYKDSSRTQIWGDGSGGTVTNAGSTGNGGGSVSFTAYGQIPAQMGLVPATYGDSIIVTVSY